VSQNVINNVAYTYYL